MFIYTEKALSKLIENPEDEDVVLEASSDNYYIRDFIYPKVEKVLSTQEGKNKFSRLVSDYINKHSTKLTAIGPMNLIPFTMDDKAGFFNLFQVEDKEIQKVVKEAVNAIENRSSFLFMTNNPIYSLFYNVIRYFTLNRDEKLLNSSLIITSLAFYPSIYSKYYVFDPNPGVMQYTIDNLSQRFIIKKTNSIFGTLSYSIKSSWNFHEKFFKEASDKQVVSFIQRIRNDQNSLMKKIKNAYMENYKKGLTVQTQVDSYEDNQVVDNENNTNKVELATTKILQKMLLNGTDLKICEFAAQACVISKLDLRNYITLLIVEKKSDEIRSLIESILFIYLYDEKHLYSEINSKQFISFALTTFKRSNSMDDNIRNIKKILEKWCIETKIYAKYSRIATRVDYSRAIFLYMILSIQKYI